MTAYTATPADTLGLSDSPTSHTITAIRVDGFDLTDVAGPTVDDTVVDPLGLVDSRVVDATVGRTAADTLTWTDSGRSAGLAVTGADRLGFTDSASTVTAGTQIGDTLHLTDPGVQLVKAVTGRDWLLYVDVSTPLLVAAIQTVTDPLTLTDVSAPQIVDIAEVLTDPLGFTDAAATASSVTTFRTATDAFTITDNPTLQAGAARAVTDALAFTDTAATPSGGPAAVVIDDTLAFTDSAAAARTMTVTDSYSLTDSQKIVHGPRKRRPGRLTAGASRGPILVGAISGPDYLSGG
jgi:hypothetical protein